MIGDIRVVLIDVFHPGNMGAVARAMKTMGVSKLYLVRPRCFPDPEAWSRAVGAKDVLDKACVCESLEDAIADCTFIVGTSARSRRIDLPLMDAAEGAKKIIKEIDSVGHSVAVVFGRETYGMTNEELLKCHAHMIISANPDFPILNLAAAVQVICYEIWKARNVCPISAGEFGKDKKYEYPTAREMEKFYLRLEHVLQTAGFSASRPLKGMMYKLRRLFNRARPEVREIKMLYGLISAVQKSEYVVHDE